MFRRSFAKSSYLPWLLAFGLPWGVSGCLSPITREPTRDQLLRAMAEADSGDENTSKTPAEEPAKPATRHVQDTSEPAPGSAAKPTRDDQTQADPPTKKSDPLAALNGLELSNADRKAIEEFWKGVDPRERDVALRALVTTFRLTAEKQRGGQASATAKGANPIDDANTTSASPNATLAAPESAAADFAHHARPRADDQRQAAAHLQHAPGAAVVYPPLQARSVGYTQPAPSPDSATSPSSAYVRNASNVMAASAVQGTATTLASSPSGFPVAGSQSATDSGFRSPARIAANQQMPYSPRLPGWNPNMPVSHSGDAQRAAAYGSTSQLAGANAGAAVAESKDWRSALAHTIMMLEDEVYNGRAANKDRAEHLETYLHLLYAASGRTEQAVEPIYSMDEDMREFWQHLLHSMTIEMETEAERPASLRSAAALRELRDAQRLLAKTSDLDIKQLTFCSAVQGFGQYEEFETARFTPEQKVLLYFEVDNFVSAKTSRGYETKLKGRYSIYDSNGNRVANREFPSSKEVCRNYRRDYFIRYLVTIPSHIEPGEYMLELTLEDETAKKFGQGVISFVLIAPNRP